MLKPPKTRAGFISITVWTAISRILSLSGGRVARISHHQDTDRLIRARQKPELVVISECFWTASAKHADIVLPATTSYERNDHHDR